MAVHALQADECLGAYWLTNPAYVACNIPPVSQALSRHPAVPFTPALLSQTRQVPAQICTPPAAGPRPSAAIALWARLLPVWERYRRWLDLVTARCGLLGARVAAARQLAEPSARGPPNAALLPHLRNKGLLLFRGHVLLAYGLRRPLQVGLV